MLEWHSTAKFVEHVEPRLFLLKLEGVSSAATSPARRGYTLELTQYDLWSLPSSVCIRIWPFGTRHCAASHNDIILYCSNIHTNSLTDGIHSSHIHVVLQVVIMLVIDKENDRALLSRQSRFVPRMWSCLAGFIEVQITACITFVIHSCV